MYICFFVWFKICLLCMHLYVEAQSWCPVSFSISLYFIEAGFLTEPWSSWFKLVCLASLPWRSPVSVSQVLRLQVTAVPAWGLLCLAGFHEALNWSFKPLFIELSPEPSTHTPCFLETCFLTGLELTKQSRLASQCGLSLHLPSLGITNVHQHAQPFNMGSRGRSQGCMHEWQAFYQLSCLFQPCVDPIFFFKAFL